MAGWGALLASLCTEGAPLIRVQALQRLVPELMRARSMASRFETTGSSAGSGTRPVIGAAASGFVPHVTIGAISASLRRPCTFSPANPWRGFTTARQSPSIFS